MYQRARGLASEAAESPKAKVDNPLRHPQGPRGGFSDNSETEQLNGRSLPRETNALPSRAMTRTALSQPEPGVERTRLAAVTRPTQAMTDVSWLILSHPCSHPTAKPVGENYRPIEDSDAEHGQDDAVVRPPRRKRRRMSTSTIATGGTAAQQQTRLYCADSRSRQIQGSSRRPKRRSQRSIPSPPYSRRSTLEKKEETVKAPVAKFEE
ncbi:hypothetical protein DL762_010271 [Monosporascus cannonballus]|uniref:Uncharacterized protein n=1 Tax=Monosporascus cannonballus TaxID=155416 RepID=A0ABY0GVR1_9PEZI|nr:hypothetical protein DL762_010271 [Monosporascus cannonballus]